MRIDSPVMTNAIITGSFSGSFVGAGNFEGLEADSVEFANVLNKPTLISFTFTSKRSNRAKQNKCF